MACPKGWEALTVLDAADRATDAAAAQRATAQLEPVDWDTRAARRSSSGSRRSRREHGAESVAFLSTARSPPRRWRCSARSPSSAWGWSTATATRGSAWPRPSSPTSSRSASTRRRTPTQDFEESDVHRPRRLEPVHRPSDHVGARACATAHQPEIIVIDPRRTETAMAATQHLRDPAEDATSCCSTAWRNLLIASGWIDRDFIDAHTDRLRRVRRVRRAVHAGARRRRDRAQRRSDRALRARRSHDGQAGLVLVDDGREPEPRGRRARRRRSSTWR